jgi:hypothetical protein
MKKYIYNFGFILISFFFIGILGQCKKDNGGSKKFDFNFPEISSIDSSVYNEIKKTCEAYWDLSNMIDTTFEIKADQGEYVVQCEGYMYNRLYIFLLRVDKNGKLIWWGRWSKKNYLNIIALQTNWPKEFII